MKVAAKPISLSLKLAALSLLAVPLWSYAQTSSQAQPQAQSQSQAQAQPQAMSPLSATDTKQIQSYTLNEDRFNRLLATSKEAKQQQIHPQKPDMSQVHSLDDLANQAVGSNKQLAALAKKHGFTPREFLLANLALMNAGMVIKAQSDPEMAKQIDQSKVNQANVNFVKAHEAQLQALSQQSQQGAAGQK